MTKLNKHSGLRHRHAATLALAVLLVAVVGLYFAEVPHNPPGFYIDESSIAYNAHEISQSGQDEYGENLPLYFRAFGDYKNPVFVYLLAAVFRVTGPGIAVARILSATLGCLSALLLGLLAYQMSARVAVGITTAITVLLTPWLFEASRLVFEVSIYPAVTAVFLLCLWRASKKTTWRPSEIITLSVSLALLTYSYSTGRLLGPLLALGLAFFIDRRRWIGIGLTWLSYAVMLIPLFVFSFRHPGALSVVSI